MRVEYQRGVWLPEAGLWLDPRDPRDFAFVSHAHADHTAAHDEIVVSEPTARLMRARVGGRRTEHILPWAQTRGFKTFEATLYPAGHVLGSAQILVTTESDTLLYTGDFKLRHGLSAEPAQWIHANTLIMETTYGLPRFRFPPTAEALAAMVKFCHETLEDGDTPVLLGYSLGKAQEILCALNGAGLRMVLHPVVARMTAIYEALGRTFPAYEVLGEGIAMRGAVLVCPPNVTKSRALRAIENRRMAMLTGWAVDSGARFRYGCDAAFALSDHADYDDLMRYVELVNPQRVLCLHGYASEFAADLRARGWEAWALTGSNQLELGLGLMTPRVTPTVCDSAHGAEETAANAAPVAAQGLGRFSRLGETIAESTGRLRKLTLLAEYLRDLPPEELRCAAIFLTGRAFAQSDSRVLQLGWASIRRALEQATGRSESELREMSRRHRDAGRTALEALAGRTQPQPMSLVEGSELLAAIAGARGPLRKQALLEKALRRLGATEGSYLVRILTGDLRIGLKEGLLEDAIARAFDTQPETIREAGMLTGDIGETAILAQERRLHEARMQPLHPVKCMLASPEPDARAVWKRFAAGPQPVEDGPTAGGRSMRLWVEDKFDGIRLQLHKADDRVELFSRDLKCVTDQFPEIASAARRLDNAVVLDGEAIAYCEGRKLTFFDLQKRLGRRDADLFLGEEIPVVCMVFDLLWLDGRSVMSLPLSERRALLETLTLPPGLRLAAVHEAADAADIDNIFDEARRRGNEGLMIKDPAGAYTPGRRGFSWVKLKKAAATLDVVVTAVEQGHGRRRNVLSDYTFAVRHDRTGALVEIGKAYSGLTDVEIEKLTRHFEQRAIERRGGWMRVTPDVVLEVAFDSVQHSRRHASGFALRFPRIKAIREDKTAAEIDTLSTAKALADGDDRPKRSEAGS